MSTIYRPPNAPAKFFYCFEKLIKQIDDENKEMYILGDLNCNLLQEKTLFNVPTSKLKSFYELYQLSQLINPQAGYATVYVQAHCSKAAIHSMSYYLISFTAFNSFTSSCTTPTLIRGCFVHLAFKLIYK